MLRTLHKKFCHRGRPLRNLHKPAWEWPPGSWILKQFLKQIGEHLQ